MLGPSIQSPGWQNSLVVIALGPAQGGKTSFVSGVGRAHNLVPTSREQQHRMSAQIQNDRDYGILHRVLAQISPDVQSSKVHCAISACQISKANQARLNSTTEEIFDLLSSSQVRLCTRKHGPVEFVLTGLEHLPFMGMSEMQTVLDRIKGNRGDGSSDLVIVIKLYHGKNRHNAAIPKDWLTTEVAQLVFVGEYVLLHRPSNLSDQAELGRTNSTADLLDFEQNASLGGQPASKALLKLLTAYRQAARHVRFLCTSPTRAVSNALRGIMIRLPLARESHQVARQRIPESFVQPRRSSSVLGSRTLIPRPLSTQGHFFEQQLLQLAQEQQAFGEPNKEWSRPVSTTAPPTFFRSDRSALNPTFTAGWSSDSTSSTPCPVEGQRQMPSPSSLALGEDTPDLTSPPVPISRCSSEQYVEVVKLSSQVSELESIVARLASRVQALESRLPESADSWAQTLSCTPGHPLT